MKVFIKETGEIRDLTALDDDGMDYIPELIEEGGIPHSFDGVPVLSEKECDWWTACLLHHEEDAREIRETARELGIPASHILEQVEAEMAGRDMDYEHAVTQAVLAEFRAGRMK